MEQRELIIAVNKHRAEALKTLIMQADTQDFRQMWADKGVMQQGGLSHKAYQGVNQIVLTVSALNRESQDPRWFTMKMIQDKGLTLNKGSKGEPIAFFSNTFQVDKKDEKGNIMRDENGKKIKETVFGKPLLRQFYVFNGKDISGLEPFTTPNHTPEELTEKRRIAFERAEEMIQNWAQDKGLKFIEFPQPSAFFRPNKESGAIMMPIKGQFDNLASYYATAFHELGHSTLIENIRTKDEKAFDVKNIEFGSPAYAREELVAELTSIYLSQELGIDTSESELNKQSLAYIKSWYLNGKLTDKDLSIALRDAEKAKNILLSYAPSLTLENKADVSLENDKQDALNTILQPTFTKDEIRLAELQNMTFKHLEDMGWRKNDNNNMEIVRQLDGKDIVFEVAPVKTSDQVLEFDILKNGESMRPADRAISLLTVHLDDNYPRLSAESIQRNMNEFYENERMLNHDNVSERVNTLRQQLLDGDLIPQTNISSSVLSDDKYRNLTGDELLAAAKVAINHKPISEFKLEDYEKGYNPNAEIYGILTEIAIRNKEHHSVIDMLKQTKVEVDEHFTALHQNEVELNQLHQEMADEHATELSNSVGNQEPDYATIFANKLMDMSQGGKEIVYPSEVAREWLAMYPNREVSFNTHAVVGRDVYQLTDSNLKVISTVLFNRENAAIVLSDDEAASLRELRQLQDQQSYVPDMFNNNQPPYPAVKFGDINRLTDFNEEYFIKPMKESGLYDKVDEIFKKVPKPSELKEDLSLIAERIMNAANDGKHEVDFSEVKAIIKSVNPDIKMGTVSNVMNNRLYELNGADNHGILYNDEDKAMVLNPSQLEVVRKVRDLQQEQMIADKYNHFREFNSLKDFDENFQQKLKEMRITKPMQEILDAIPKVSVEIDKQIKSLTNQIANKKFGELDYTPDALETSNETLIENTRLAIGRMRRSDDYQLLRKENPEEPIMGNEGPAAKAYGFLAEVAKRAGMDPLVVDELESREYRANDDFLAKREEVARYRNDVAQAFDKADVSVPAVETYLNLKNSEKFVETDVKEVVETYVNHVRSELVAKERDPHVIDMLNKELDFQTKPMVAAMMEKNNVHFYAENYQNYPFNVKADNFKMLTQEPYYKDGKIEVEALRELVPAQLKDTLYSSGLDEEVRRKNAENKILIVPSDKEIYFANTMKNGHNILSFDYTDRNDEVTHRQVAVLSIDMEKGKFHTYDIDREEHRSFFIEKSKNFTHIGGISTNFEKFAKQFPENGLVVPFEAAKHLLADAKAKIDLNATYENKTMAEFVFKELLNEGTQNIQPDGKRTIVNDSIMNKIERGLHNIGNTAIISSVINSELKANGPYSEKTSVEGDFAIKGGRLFPDAVSSTVFADNSALLQYADKFEIVDGTTMKGYSDLGHNKVEVNSLFELAKEASQHYDYFFDESAAKEVTEEEARRNIHVYHEEVPTISGGEFKNIHQDIATLSRVEMPRGDLSKYYSPEAIEQANNSHLAMAEVVRNATKGEIPSPQVAKEILDQNKDQILSNFIPQVLSAKWIIRDEQHPPLVFSDNSILKQNGEVEYKQYAFYEESEALKKEQHFNSPNAIIPLIKLNEMEIEYAKKRNDDEAVAKYTAMIPEVKQQQRIADPAYNESILRQEQAERERAERLAKQEQERIAIQTHNELYQEIIKQPESLADIFVKETKGLTINHEGEYSEDHYFLSDLMDEIENYKMEGYDRDLLARYNEQPKREFVYGTIVEPLKFEMETDNYERLKNAIGDDATLYVFQDDSILVLDDKMERYAVIQPKDVDISTHEVVFNGKAYPSIKFDDLDLDLFENLKFNKISLDNAMKFGYEPPVSEEKAENVAVTETVASTPKPTEIEVVVSNDEALPTHAYVLTNKDMTRAFALGTSVEHAKDLFNILHSMEIEDLAQEEELVFRPIAVPIERVMFPAKYLAPSEDTMLTLIKEDAKYRVNMMEIEYGLSQAELVAENITNGSKPTPEQAAQILKGIGPQFDNIHEPHFNLNDRGSEVKDVLVFADGSKLDMRGSTFIPDANKAHRVEVEGKISSKAFAEQINPDFNEWKETYRSLYDKHQETLKKHETIKMR